VDHYTRQEIEKVAWKILNDAGLTEPPIKPDDLIEHLRLNLDFYSLEDPGFVKTLTHKFNIKVQHLKKALQKSKLVAGWMPDCSKIVIDGTLPEKKKIFPQFHEITHSILPWHKDFFLGDTAQTLDHDYQEALEIEANYGASELMFCGPVFRKEVVYFDVSIKSVKELGKRYDNSLVTTVRKLVRSQAEANCFALVSIPTWFESEKLPGAVKSLEPSTPFTNQFSTSVSEAIVSQVNSQVHYRKGGPLGEFNVTISDRNGDCFEFECETFFNTHEIITLGILAKKVDGLIAVDF
jgi:Zn-dependent peptidase ImmA (M78 family)